MPVVYVLNKEGKPLMPTTRCGHVRILLKEKKARVVEIHPFTIQLNYETPDAVQPIVLGIDPGRTNIGLCAITEDGKEKMSVQIITRNKDIPKLMASRKAARQHRRKLRRRDKRRRRARKCGTVKATAFTRKLPGCEKTIVCHDIKNKEARFSHRTRPAGWLTPTARQLLLTHVNAIKKMQKYLPIMDVVLELNKFAFMAMENPNIKPWEYQKGPLYKTGGLHAAVSAQQKHHCIFCKQAIEHYHHVIPRSKGGSNTIDNIAGLCDKHHDLVHKVDGWTEKLAKKKTGLNKKYGALSMLNQIIPSLERELAAMYPEHAFATNGKSTKRFRDAHDIPKDHYLDAYCIANTIMEIDAPSIDNVNPLYMKQYRRHDRQIVNQEMIDRKYYLNGELVATNRHKRTEQKTDSLEEYRAKLICKYGKEYATTIISKLKAEDHEPTLKSQDRVMPGALMFDTKRNAYYVLNSSQGKHKGVPDYYIDTTGKKHRSKKSRVCIKNQGLVFCKLCG